MISFVSLLAQPTAQQNYTILLPIYAQIFTTGLYAWAYKYQHNFENYRLLIF